LARSIIENKKMGGSVPSVLPLIIMASVQPFHVIHCLFRLFYCTKYDVCVWVGKRLFVNRIVESQPKVRASVHACAHLHVCARARLRLRASYMRTHLVASDLLSSPVSRRTALTPSFPRHQHTLRAPIDAFARDTHALLHVCARTRSRLHARYIRASFILCARSRVSKHTRGRRAGREACFLHLYEPIYSMRGYVPGLCARWI
jgi:hypothetical protein